MEKSNNNDDFVKMAIEKSTASMSEAIKGFMFNGF